MPIPVPPAPAMQVEAAPVAVTPVSLDRLADDFAAICVAPNGDAAAMNAAAEAYKARYPGADRPSYGAVANKKSVACFVFGTVVPAASPEQLRALATGRFHADLAPARKRGAGELAWKTGQASYQAQVTDQRGQRVGMFSVSFPKDAS